MATEFKRQRLDMADAGEPFISNDVNDRTHSRRQFVRGYVFHDRTIVWYYHGGITTHFHIVELRMQRDTFEPHAMLHLTGANLLSYGASVCHATQAIIDGVTSATDW